MATRRRTSAASLLLAGLAIVAACGDDGDGAEASAPTTAALAVAAAPATTVAVAPVEDLGDLSVRLNITQWGSYHAGMAIAETQGWYDEAGIDVSFGTGTGSTPTAQQVAGGSDDIAFTSADAVSRVNAQGGDLKMFSNILPDAGNCLMVKADSGITGPEQMEGRTIGDAAGFITLQVMPALWNAVGVEASSVNVITVDPASRVQAWLSGQYEGLPSFVFGEPITASMRFQQDNECFMLSDYGVQLVGFGLVATSSLLEDRPDAVQAFTDMSMRGYEYAFENPQEAAAAIRELAGNDPNLAPEPEIIAAIEALIPLARTDADAGQSYGYNSPERWSTMIATMQEFAELDPSLDAATLYTNEFIG